MNPAPRSAPAIPTRMAGVFKALTPISDGQDDPDAEWVYDRISRRVGNRTDQAVCAGMRLRLDCIYGTSWFAGAGMHGVGRSQDVAYCADAPRMKAARSLLCCTRLGSWTYIMWPAG